MEEEEEEEEEEGDEEEEDNGQHNGHMHSDLYGAVLSAGHAPQHALVAVRYFSDDGGHQG